MWCPTNSGGNGKSYRLEFQADLKNFHTLTLSLEKYRLDSNRGKQGHVKEHEIYLVYYPAGRVVLVRCVVLRKICLFRRDKETNNPHPAFLECNFFLACGDHEHTCSVCNIPCHTVIRPIPYPLVLSFTLPVHVMITFSSYILSPSGRFNWRSQRCSRSVHTRCCEI